MKTIIKKLIVFLVGWLLMTITVTSLFTILMTSNIALQIFSATFIVLIVTVILLCDYINNLKQ